MEPCLFRHGKGGLIFIRSGRIQRLQWSHVFSDMVRSNIAELRGLVETASMEPCLFRHGKET